ncbi:TAXI family TRAP transporter solute-binding subunit [Paracoccus laeviglucosivorans]|uniref:TAXI family TRAP transporter solute-binding subunit n=1 Tax=Paracoccus laeviglucosivorans TaxID=1197861 RepID=UPI001FE9F6C9|nr:TAXI family TRAP transporter solute-binding subunit [Paracoccus laeviglucosivorans]
MTGLAFLLSAGRLNAQAPRFFRIGTGSTGGTYFPIGSLIANAVSAPPGTPVCDNPGDCGVPGLVASAIATGGSVANVHAIEAGRLESGLVQADVATFAHSGSGIWQGKPPAKLLRAIANLYPETVHLVASRASQITAIGDLIGKRVAWGEKDSGTLVDAGLILSAAGIAPDQIEASYLPLETAAIALQDGKVDALFFTGGPPVPAIAVLASRADLDFIPISGALRDRIVAENPFFATDRIVAGSYRQQEMPVETISVGAQWVTSADQPEELIHDITRALWSPIHRRMFDAGHRRGESIQPANALMGITIPLHDGAARYYRENHLIR